MEVAGSEEDTDQKTQFLMTFYSIKQLELKMYRDML
jgi:hypothetical protein